MGTKEIQFPAAGLMAVETNAAPIEKINGTNVDKLVCAFDDTTEEYRNGILHVPTDVDTSGTVTFRAYLYAKTAAASKNIELRFGHVARNDSEAFDTAYTNVDSGDKAIDATQGDLTEVTFTATVSTLSWAASDQVYFRVSRIAPSANNLSGDMYLESFAIEVPTT